MNKNKEHNYMLSSHVLNDFDYKITTWEVKRYYTHHYQTFIYFLQDKIDMKLKKVNRPLMTGQFHDKIDHILYIIKLY